MASSSLSAKIRFGAFDLDAGSGELRKGGTPLKLRLQAIQVLLMLTERAGQVVTRDEIRQRLWKTDTFVDFERSINFCINQIRTALGDDAEKPRYVETLPRRGYRFIAPVTVEVSRDPTPIVMLVPPLGRSLPAPGGLTTTDSGSSGIPVVRRHPAQEEVRPRTRKRGVVLAGLLTAISLAVGYAAHTWLSRTKVPGPQDLGIATVTNSGRVTGIAISADGRYLAYAEGQAGKEGLWLNELPDHRQMQVLPNGPGFHGLTFSPDGSKIYFVRSDEKDPFFKYLYSMPTLGGPVQKLITDVDSPVTFSPDGRQFAYEHCIQPRNDIELKLANADGSEERLLTIIHDGSGFLFQPGPNWSPDGRTIAIPVLIANQRLRWVLDIVSVAGGSIREFYSSREELGRPVWLPDQTGLMFPRFDESAHRFQMWTISFPGGLARPLTHDLSHYGTDLDMTRDGHTFATTATTMISHIWIARALDLSQSQQVTSDPLSMIEITEASDGKLLARGGDELLWMMHTDGSQRLRFSELSRVNSPSPCGRYVILLAGRSDTKALVRVDRDGTHPATLAQGNLWSPVCSADGDFVFYATFEQPQKIWRVPIGGGTPQYVSDVPGDQLSGRLTVSPNGKFLAYPYTQFSRVPSEGWRIGVMPVAGGRLIKQFKVPEGFLGVRWSPSGTGLQYVVTQNGASNIWEQPLMGGTSKQLTHFATDEIFDFSWSTDGTRLLLTRGFINTDAVLLSNLH